MWFVCSNIKFLKVHVWNWCSHIAIAPNNMYQILFLSIHTAMRLSMFLPSVEMDIMIKNFTVVCQ